MILCHHAVLVVQAVCAFSIVCCRRALFSVLCSIHHLALQWHLRHIPSCVSAMQAARATILHEVQSVFAAYGIGVDVRHLGLIADFMTHQACAAGGGFDS